MSQDRYLPPQQIKILKGYMSENYDIWQTAKNESFLYINQRSNVKDHWMSYNQVAVGKFKDSILKPINGYVENLYPFPKLISIEDNIIRLRQNNHAQIFLKKEKGGLYHIDRPWIRQYYRTDIDSPEDETTFSGVFRFYVPWFIDSDITVSIEQPTSTISPFIVFEDSIEFKKKTNLRKVDPPFVKFKFKRVGPHMLDNEFGKINKNTPMFDMVFKGSDIMIKSIEEFYEKEH